MKRILSVLWGVLMALPIFSQEYQPRETWPFIYETFEEGSTRTRDGNLTEGARFNVAVHDGSLMYIAPDETIMKADMSRVYTAKIGDDVYVNISGKMYKLLSELDCGLVVTGTQIDMDKMQKVNIGYGISSSTASAHSLSVLMDGRFDTTHKSLAQTELDKYTGDVLPIREIIYLKVGLDLIPASRQEILSLPGIDKKAANAFFKEEKIKWKETASLEKLLVFVNEQLNK